MKGIPVRLDCKTLVLVGSLFIQLMASQGWAETSIDEALRAAYMTRLFALETRLAILTSRRKLTSSELSSIRVLRTEQERLRRRLRVSRDYLQERPHNKKRSRLRHQSGRLNHYDDLIMEASKTYGLSAALIKAVIKVESNFDPYAVSRVGACGLMQIMPETAKALGVINSFNPRENIFGGTRLLRRHIDEFGSLKNALIAYNAGEQVAKGRIKVPKETREYVKKVIHHYQAYKR